MLQNISILGVLDILMQLVQNSQSSHTHNAFNASKNVLATEHTYASLSTKIKEKKYFKSEYLKKTHLPQGIAKNKKHDTSEHAENLCRQFGVQYKNLIENETLITKKIRHRKLNRYILNKQREKYSSMGVTCFRQTMRHTLGCFPKF